MSQVMIFDQLEELFNIYSDPDKWHEEQEDFFKEIADTLESDPLLRAVFVIREDYLAQLDPFANFLPERLRARFRLERLRQDAAKEAIKGPLEKAKADADIRAIDRIFDGVIDRLIEELLKIRVETFGGQSREIKGEFVEPIQLQLVCQRLWNKLKTSQIDHISQDFIAYLGDVDIALEDFYAETIREASKQSNISEDIIRLITSSETRGIVHRGFKSTGSIPNTAVDILEKKYLIRKEERSGAQWYELTHDRFIKPILDSNKKWKDKLQEEKEKIFAELWRKAVAVTKLQSENNQVLAAYYETIIKKSIKKTKHQIGEDELRNWFENTLITPEGTLGVVHNDNASVGGIPNKVADVLEEELLIRKGEGSGSQWYTLTDDRLIKPIKDSNKAWKNNNERKKNRLVVKVAIPVSIVIAIVSFILILNFSNHPTPPGAQNIDDPLSIFVNPSTNMAYVANGGDNTVSVIDGKTDTVKADIEVGYDPDSVSIDPSTKMVYVTNANNNVLSVIDGKTNTVTDSIGVSTDPVAVSIDPYTNMVYVANRGNNTVSVIDDRTDTVKANIKVGTNPNAVAINPLANIVYVTNGGDNTVSVIDGKTNTVKAKIKVGTDPDSVSIDPHANMVYVANAYDNALSVIDGKTNTVTATIPVGNSPQAISVNPSTDIAYVANSDDNTVSVIDGKTNTVTSIIYGSKLLPNGVPVGTSPYDVFANPSTNMAYVANDGSNTVSVIDGKTNKVTATIPVG